MFSRTAAWLLLLTVVLAAQAVAGDQAAANRRLLVAGGKRARPDAFPFFVSLRAPVAGNYTATEHWCGGSLIHPRIVLTAAHCLGVSSGEDHEVPKANLPVRVDVGRWAANGKSNGTQSFVPLAGLVQSNYTEGSLTNDIALLILDLPSTNEPVQLPPAGSSGDELLTPDEPLTAIGLGETRNGSLPGALRQVQLPYISEADCSDFYAEFEAETAAEEDLWGPGLICAGKIEGDWWDTNATLCTKDDGGPLIKRSNGTAVQYGVFTAPVTECRAADAPPPAFTDVAFFRDWIDMGSAMLLEKYPSPPPSPSPSPAPSPSGKQVKCVGAQFFAPAMVKLDGRHYPLSTSVVFQGQEPVRRGGSTIQAKLADWYCTQYHNFARAGAFRTGLSVRDLPATIRPRYRAEWGLLELVDPGPINGSFTTYAGFAVCKQGGCVIGDGPDANSTKPLDGLKPSAKEQGFYAIECLPENVLPCGPDGRGGYGMRNTGAGNFGIGNRGSANYGSSNDGSKCVGSHNRGSVIIGSFNSGSNIWGDNNTISNFAGTNDKPGVFL